MATTVILLMAGTRNGVAEFCTSKAYGWPIAMRYDYCPCGSMMGKDPAPAWAIVANSLLVLLAGAGVQYLWVIWKRRGGPDQSDASFQGDAGNQKAQQAGDGDAPPRPC